MGNMRVFSSTVLGCVLAVTALALPAAGQTQPSPGKPEINKPALEAYLRHLYAWGPEVKLELGEPKPSAFTGMTEVALHAAAGTRSFDQVLLLSGDGKKFTMGTVYDIEKNPFQADLDKLGAAASGPSLGTAGAPVVIVLFTDYQCPYCRTFAQTIRSNLIASYPKEVRLYLKEFPLEPIHPWAKPAAMAGRCVYQQNPDAFWQFHDWIFEQQEQITPQSLRERVLQFAEGRQLEPLGLSRCLDRNETQGDVAASVALAQSLRVDATPTMFINGRKIGSGVGWPQLKNIIDNELEYQKTAKNAGDKCCEVSLPSPLAR
jgi:protein-disulfide isomerase